MARRRPDPDPMLRPTLALTIFNATCLVVMVVGLVVFFVGLFALAG